jgi:HD-GYP domain-containing protein (c-di-GMP phosphodiesterase class II)
MRKISIEDATPGMKLGRSIYTIDGFPLLSQGIELSQVFIDRLKFINIMDIYIDDEISKGIEVNDVISDSTRNQAKVVIREIMEHSKKKTKFNSAKAKIVVNYILDDLLSNRNIVVNLSDIKTKDNYTYEHSVNVCVLSLVTGIKLGLNQLKLRDLGIGALLHDIGKVEIPSEIILKPSNLTNEEYEIIKTHTIKGYELLKTDIHMRATSAYVALGHHERIDGNGYPLKRGKENIHDFARIVAVADVFDALTSDRVYRKKLKTFEALEYITCMEDTQFDKEVVKCFLETIALYAAGTFVILDNGEKGIVTEVNKDYPNRPKIRITNKADGSSYGIYKEVDLSKTLNLVIVDACDY